MPMLKAINTKLPPAILAALAAIGGSVAYQRHVTEKTAAAAATGAAILQQQQRDAEEQRSVPAASRAEQEAAQLRSRV
jgi:hypothetical protein